MQNKLASGARLGRQALLFPLCLVLYEFSTYIGNDMIQPGMLPWWNNIRRALIGVPTSMTAYLAGGMFFTMAAGAAVGSYWSPSGDAGGSGVVYRHLSGNIAGAKH